jgi:site-specific DNA-methyltransferase (adenine-specific)
MTHFAFNADCMEIMSRYPDKWFDLAVVDPPYGIGATKTMGVGDTRKGKVRAEKWQKKEWDDNTPSADYFNILLLKSKNQIIWGGNYFTNMLTPSRCWLIWDKVWRVDQADAEIAWTSFKTSIRVFSFNQLNLVGFRNPNRFHPTEKPVALYDWIFKNYLPNGGRVLDTHGGSMSSLISAIKAGNIEMTISELDADYYASAQKRVNDFMSQLNLFQERPEIIW